MCHINEFFAHQYESVFSFCQKQHVGNHPCQALVFFCVGFENGSIAIRVSR